MYEAYGPELTICLEILFDATSVYECLISVPFNPAVASRFLQYYNDTIQFQSTLAYLASPPPSYQQPAVDLVAGLAQIQRDIDNGLFQNEYAFEAALQKLIYSAHDAHLTLMAGVLAPFMFGSPYSIASVSLDGIELPKVYIAGRLIPEPGDHLGKVGPETNASRRSTCQPNGRSHISTVGH
jgi:hypothetical protein